MNGRGNLPKRFARSETGDLWLTVAAVLVYWLAIQVVLQAHSDSPDSTGL